MPQYPFIEGEPATFLSKGEKQWQNDIQVVCSHVLQYPCLNFVVNTWKRKGNYFDLDNISKPVLDIVGKEAITVWTSVDLSTISGVTISNQVPSMPSSLYQDPIYIKDPPTQSTRPAPLLPELKGQSAIGNEEPLGLVLMFDSIETCIGNFDFKGPIKPLIDSLGPLLGTYHQGAKDYRIHEMRVIKRCRANTRGVSVGLWFLVNDQLRDVKNYSV